MSVATETFALGAMESIKGEKSYSYDRDANSSTD